PPRTIVSVMTENINNIYNFSVNVTPNPITRTAIINYSLPVTGKALLKLYNSSGRLVETLLDNTMTAGTYSMNLNATKLAKGVYFLKYEANHEKSEIKLIIQ
ncbi:MAG: T9SS type A sorting domain-containing protein, partial [Candidatus Latescibacteria bacterium]|nr:T9SS type A sorting domain-containing protein [Candidatus Latescibacterota bacterium]